MAHFESFADWAQLTDHVRAGYRLFYQAPLDYRPVLVTAVIRKDGKLRVTPPYSNADPFTADNGHLTRFRREAK
jgi:hypothetical protein